MKGIIYKATNKINGKSYIGQTIKKLSERKRGHKWHSKNNTKFHFYNALRKHGWENFSWKIIEQIPVEKLNDREVYFIEKYDTYDNGYNTTTGGNQQYTFPEKVKNKIRLSKMGSKNPMYGKKHESKHNEKIAWSEAKILYFMETPDPIEHDFWLFNLKRFCKVRGLHSGSMYDIVNVNNKRAFRSQHKGYKVQRVI